MSPRLLLVTLLSIGVTAARAHPDDQPVDNIVVTASREPHAVGKLPATTDVVPYADIEPLRSVSLTDVLRHRAGLHIDQPGARGGRSSVYTRGLDPNHTLVMIDGIPLNDETNARGGSFDFSTITALDIDRVEIIRGPISAVHGSAAMAGAINIIPRRGARETAASLDLSGGGDGYYRGRAMLSGSNGPIDLSLGGSYTDESTPDEIGNFRGGEVISHLGVALTDDAEVRGTLRYSDSRGEAFPDFSGGPRLSINREKELRDAEELAAAIRLEHAPTSRFHYTARAQVYRRIEWRSTPTVFAAEDVPANPGEPDTRQTYLRYTGSLSGTATLADGIEVTIGSDAYQEDGRSRGDIDLFGTLIPGDFDLDRHVIAPFTELYWSTPIGVTVLAGLRVDLPEGRSEELLPRVGVSYVVPKLDTNLHTSWGQGFKLPSFFALASPLAGNPNLRPERSKGFDVGVEQPLWDERIDLRITYFDIDVSGLIDFDAETFSLANLDDTDSRGAELEMRARPFDSLDLRLHTTYLDATGRRAGSSDSQRLRNRPQWRGGFGITWSPIESVEANLQALFVGDTTDTAAPTGPDPVRIPAYQRFDLALAWRPLDHLGIYLAIDNLTDSHYEEILGFPVVGIRPRAGIELIL